MDYISQYFNKASDELDYQDIANFFQVEQEESDKIEFKSFVEVGGGSYKDKEKGILRSICGFLNSGGGIVIWGAPRGQVVAGRKEKAFVGALSPLNIRIEKDAFISKITNSITPAPVGVRFISLQNGDSYVYVIEVQKSDYSPHQFGNTYFMRIDGQTNPAPHHYVDALFRKITYPRLLGYVVLERLEYHNGIMGRDMVVLSVSVVIFNLSKLQNENKPFFRLVSGLGASLGNGISPSLTKSIL